MLAATAARVEQNTPAAINRAIQHEIDCRLRYYAGRPEEISHRLAELHREWDIERALEANAAIAALIGLTIGVLVDRRVLAVPFAVAGFCCSMRSKDGARRCRCCAGSGSAPPPRSVRNAAACVGCMMSTSGAHIEVRCASILCRDASP
jgi:hypothetical protein